MVSRLRSWWQAIQQHPIRLAIIIGIGAFVIALLVAFIGGYVFNWGWTGFGSYTPPTKESNFQRAKTFWDWLQLLIVPIVLAIAGFGLNQMQKKREEKTTEDRAKAEREAAEKRAQTELDIASDNQRETALQAYIDSMSELLLHEKLRESQPGDEVRKLARVRTLTVLPRLDSLRKRSVLQFLHESGLIDIDKCIVDLNGAELQGANLRGASLTRANLSNTYLEEANFWGAHLNEANLNHASLSKADLGYAKLEGANLSGAYLVDADLHEASLQRADLTEANLQGADLGKADLRNAHLKKADLSGASLNHAHLENVELEEAILWRGMGYIRLINQEGDILSRAGIDMEKVNFNLNEEDFGKALLERYRNVFSETNVEELSDKLSIVVGRQQWEADLSGAIMPDGKIHP